MLMGLFLGCSKNGGLEMMIMLITPSLFFLLFFERFVEGQVYFNLD